MNSQHLLDFRIFSSVSDRHVASENFRCGRTVVLVAIWECFRYTGAVRMVPEVIELVDLETGREQVKFAGYQSGLVFHGN